MARRTELTSKLAAELPSARSYACDVAEATSVESAFAAMRADLGDVDALIYNAGSGVWGNVEEVKAELTFDPPWSPERMSEDAKFILGIG